MAVVEQGVSVGSFPYLFALVLSGGSLVTYLIGTLVSRYILEKEGKTAKSFNLGIPLARNNETLFAVSLAAAQTTFSTVFVVFLTGAGTLGLHLLYCPFAFAAGNWLMLFVYRQVEARGYIDHSSNSGLVPYLVYRFTHSRFISYCLAAVCILPIVAILALELRYGIGLLDHLGQKAFPSMSLGGLTTYAVSEQLVSFGIFASFMFFLLGYVFVGGFRAVIASDVWQYRIMVTALSFVCMSVIWLVATARGRLSWGQLGHPSTKDLIAFYVAVTIIDLFEPICFATTWQRFRAFRDHSTDFARAIRRATTKVAYLWVMLIFIGVGLQLISPEKLPGRLPELMDHVASINVWFQLFVFPLLIVAGYSGMYSSSDTCVSALLYLTETGRAWKQPSSRGEVPLRRQYYWAMGAVFTMTFLMYAFMKQTRGVDPVNIAIMLFGNAVVLAPTVLLLTKLDLHSSQSEGHARSLLVGASIVLGFATYWLVAGLIRDWAVAGGPAAVSGLIASAIPAYMLLLRERRIAISRKEEESVRSVS